GERDERQNAVGADQPERLDTEGYEGGQVEQAQTAQEYERDQVVARWRVIPAPQQQADAVAGGPVRGNEAVGELADRGESRQSAIEREPETFAGGVAQRQKAGLGGRRPPAVGGDVLRGAPELRDRHARIVNGQLLVGPVAHPIAGEPLPVPRPELAEAAVAVVDEHGAGVSVSRRSGSYVRSCR